MLSQDQDRQNSALTKVGQQFVHLQDQKSLVRHCIEVAIQTVDDDHSRAICFNTALNIDGELAWRQLGWINLLQADEATVKPALKVEAQGLGARLQCSSSFIEGKEHRMFPSIGSRKRIAQSKG